MTRPAAQAAEWVQALRGLGQEAAALPLLEIGPVADPALVRAAWAALGRCSLVMFVSANAVTHFFALAGDDAVWPSGPRAACVGPGTAQALRLAGVPGAQVLQPPADGGAFDSEALWALLAHEEWSGRRVLVVRGEDGRNWFADTLRERGAEVEFITAYRRLPPQPDAAGQALLLQALAAPAAHLWLFSSSEGVAALGALAPAADWSRSGALATHPRIAQAATRLGFGRVGGCDPTPAAVAAEAARWPSIQSAPP